MRVRRASLASAIFAALLVVAGPVRTDEADKKEARARPVATLNPSDPRKDALTRSDISDARTLPTPFIYSGRTQAGLGILAAQASAEAQRWFGPAGIGLSLGFRTPATDSHGLISLTVGVPCAKVTIERSSFFC